MVSEEARAPGQDIEIGSATNGRNTPIVVGVRRLRLPLTIRWNEEK